MPNETISVKTKTGEIVDVIIPSGMSDAQAKIFLATKRPELFGNNVAARPEADALLRQSQMNTLGTIEGGPEASKQQADAKLIANRQGPAKQYGPGLASNYSQQHPVGAVIGGIPGASTNIEPSLFAALGTPATGEMAAGKLATIYPKFSSAKSALNAIEKAAGKQIVDISAPEAIASRIQELQKTGGTPPKLIKNFIDRLEDVKAGPLTLNEARDFYKNATKLSVDERKAFSGEMGMHIKQFAGALNQAIAKAAESGAGMGAKYLDALKEYHRASTIQRVGDVARGLATKQVVQGAATGAGIAAGGGIGYALLKAAGVIK